MQYLLLFFQGKLEDGTEFDSSIPRGDPLTFTLGAGQVIKGLKEIPSLILSGLCFFVFRYCFLLTVFVFC